MEPRNPGRTDAAALILLAACAAVISFSGLGSRRAPRTYWPMLREGETATADLRGVAEVARVSWWHGLGEGACAVEFSLDGSAWERVGTLEQADPFGSMEWRVLPVEGRARHLRLTVLRPGLELGEVGAFSADGRRIDLVGAGGPAEPFDEPASVSADPTARTGMYFDETYFARAAWQQLRGLPVTETSHPPLGRSIISLGILLWGMNPLGWRFMPALAGALAVPVLYTIGRRLFGRASWAAFAGVLFLFDFLRIAQSRMATVDVFVLFFVLLASWFLLEHARGSRSAAWLLGAGLALGAGMACKWSAAFPGIGLAVLYLASEMRKAREAGERGISPGSLLRGALCLLIVPAVVYASSWAPLAVPGGPGIAAVVDRHLLMYRYHSTVAETRWYASPWWQWPLDTRPIWLFEGGAAGRVASIVTMGNPAISWAGTAAIPAAAILAIARRDRAAAWILAVFLAAWLPWAVSSRSLTFIYHFLPASPFMVLALTLCLGRLTERFPRLRAAALAYAGVVVALFVLFLPLLAGIPVRRPYAEALQWLDTWIFVAPGAGA